MWLYPDINVKIGNKLEFSLRYGDINALEVRNMKFDSSKKLSNDFSNSLDLTRVKQVLLDEELTLFNDGGGRLNCL